MIENVYNGFDLGEFIGADNMGVFGMSIKHWLDNNPDDKKSVVDLVEQLVSNINPDLLAGADRKQSLGKYGEPKTPDEMSGIGRNRLAELLGSAQALRATFTDKDRIESIDKLITALALTLEAFDMTAMFDKRAASLQFRNLRP